MKGNGYDWTFWDYAQAPFALTVGALSALPDDSFGFACSIYVQSSRQYIESAREFFTEKEKLDGYTAIHDSLSFTGSLGNQCYYAFADQVTVDHFQKQVAEPAEIGINLLYNMGTIWVDIQNWIYYTPLTVPQGDWGYFVLYLFGNAFMCIWYRDTSLATQA